MSTIPNSPRAVPSTAAEAQAAEAPSTLLPGGRVPSLDGLRAVSIALVLLGHLSGTRGFGTLSLGVRDHAHLGVVVFFVISGFLITRLLLEEHAAAGRVSLSGFYLRRALRLFPAASAYLLCLYLAGIVGLVQPLAPRALLQAVTYTVNFLPDPPWVLGHLWSLSVEEQFYLLWPLAFVALGPRRALWVAAAAVLLGPVSRAAGWLWLRGSPYGELNLFPMVADSLAMGCLFARAAPWLLGQRWYSRLLRPVPSLLVLALVLLINRWQDYTIASVAGASLLNLGVAVLVHRSAVHHRDLLGRLLNARPLVVVGGLSYSLYLWQQPFLDRASSAWSAAWPQNLVLAVTVALASYYLLEKPLLRLRRGLRSAPSTREAPALRGQRSGSSLGPRAPVGASADASQSAN